MLNSSDFDFFYTMSMHGKLKAATAIHLLDIVWPTSYDPNFTRPSLRILRKIALNFEEEPMIIDYI